MEENIVLKTNSLKNQLFVANIVTRILEHDNHDGVVSDVDIDDYGQCIHVTIEDASGLMSSTAMKIGQAFGDVKGANIHALDQYKFQLEFLNIDYWSENEPVYKNN